MSVYHYDQLQRIMWLIAHALEDNNLMKTAEGEALQFFGVVILATRFMFGKRSDLWAPVHSSNIIPSPAFRFCTGLMWRHFDDLWSCIASSEQASETGATTFSGS